MPDFSVICFDADDTLWVNEPYFQEAEQRFAALMEDFLPHHSVSRELLQTEIANLPIYGYGVKAFMLSMVETALRVSANTIRPESLSQIIAIGRELLARPIELLEGVEETLAALQGRYRLVVATKGDLLDQERKLDKSGLAAYFHHIEIMSEKREGDYAKLLRHLDIPAERFVMVGNSLKSDVLPVLALGGHGVHVPYHTTWAAERVDFEVEHANFRQVGQLREILRFLLP